MPKAKLPIYNPKLNEYLYERLRTLTAEQKRLLSPADLHIFRSDQDIRRFVTWGTLDKKFAIMTKVGIQWHLLISPDRDKAKDLLMKVYKQHTMKSMRLETIDEMYDKQVFVLENKQVAIALSMLAQNSHSDMYFLNKDFIKAGATIRNAHTSMNRNPLNPEFLQSEDSFRFLAKLMFNILAIENFIRSEGLEMIDIFILLFMFQRPNLYQEIRMIQGALHGIYRPAPVARYTAKLFENDYLEKLASRSTYPSYTITAKGIMIVGRVLQSAVNRTMNF